MEWWNDEETNYLSLTLGAGSDFSLSGWSWGQTVLGILSMTTFGLVDTRVWQTFLRWNKKHDILSKSITRLTLAFCSTVSVGQGHSPQLGRSDKSGSGYWHTSPPPPWQEQEHISGSGHPCRFSEMFVRSVATMWSMLSSSHLWQIFAVFVNVDNSALHVSNSFTFLTTQDYEIHRHWLKYQRS